MYTYRHSQIRFVAISAGVPPRPQPAQRSTAGSASSTPSKADTANSVTGMSTYIHTWYIHYVNHLVFRQVFHPDLSQHSARPLLDPLRQPLRKLISPVYLLPTFILYIYIMVTIFTTHFFRQVFHPDLSRCCGLLQPDLPHPPRPKLIRRMQ